MTGLAEAPSLTPMDLGRFRQVNVDGESRAAYSPSLGPEVDISRDGVAEDEWR